MYPSISLLRCSIVGVMVIDTATPLRMGAKGVVLPLMQREQMSDQRLFDDLEDVANLQNDLYFDVTELSARFIGGNDDDNREGDDDDDGDDADIRNGERVSTTTRTTSPSIAAFA